MKQKYTVYKHISPSGKCYIGQTSCAPASKRWLPNPESKYRTSIKLRNAIRKYGWNSFYTEILATDLSKKQANRVEIESINKFGSVRFGYNLQSGGKNFNHSEETKRRIGIGNTGKKRSADFRQVMSVRQKERMTPEYKKILSQKCSGWKHTEKAKLKISQSSTGKHYTLGRKQSNDEKKMRSDIAKNVLPLPCGHKRHNRYTKSCLRNKTNIR